MNIIYGKSGIYDYTINQIVELFAVNYGKYHYKKFQSHKGIMELIKDEHFDCVYIVEEKLVCGFAGFYVKLEPEDKVTEVSLAHLLVNHNVRGKGYGTMLEEARLEMIKRIKGEKVIFASCVENPCRSIKMKLNRNFYVGGFRYSYRPSGYAQENAVILINPNGVNRTMLVEEHCSLTQCVITKGNPNIIYKSMVPNVHYSVEISIDKVLGRTVYNILKVCTEGVIITSDVLNQIKNNTVYVVVRISPTIDGFCNVDKVLVENAFFPLSYIPFINGGGGMLEYQYLKNGIVGIMQDNSISQTAQEFLKSLVKKENRYIKSSLD